MTYKLILHISCSSSLFFLSIENLDITMGATGGGLSNQALSKVPAQVKKPILWLCAIWASYCGALHGFNSSNIAGVMGMSTFRQEFGWDHLSSGTVANYRGWVTSSMLLVSIPTM